MVLTLIPAGTPVQSKCAALKQKVAWTWGEAEKGLECWIVSQGMKKTVYLVAQTQLFLNFLPLPKPLMLSLQLCSLRSTQLCPLCTLNDLPSPLLSLGVFFSQSQMSPRAHYGNHYPSSLTFLPVNLSLSSDTALLSGPLQVSLFCLPSVPQDLFSILFVQLVPIAVWIGT